MRLKIRRPDDMHVHLRSGRMLELVTPCTARQFSRAVVMPNAPPINDARHMVEYRSQILRAAHLHPDFPWGGDFQPLMTFKIGPDTTIETIRDCKSAGAVAGKLYPDGVTTGSESGVRDFSALYPVYAEMQKQGLVLCIHGELPPPIRGVEPDGWVPISQQHGGFCLDREADILPKVRAIVDDFPKLRVVLEHITTRKAVEWVQRAPVTVAATITVHHLVLTLDDVLGGGSVGRAARLHPHHYCAPIAKHSLDRAALLSAALSGSPKFFLGTDSAPHLIKDKLAACGCAGVFVPDAMSILATIFDSHNSLDKLEAYTSEFGANFYKLNLNQDSLELEQVSHTIPCTLYEHEQHGFKSLSGVDNGVAVLSPFLAGYELKWQTR